MGVFAVTELSRTGAVDAKGVRTYTRKFMVLMNTSGGVDGPPAPWIGLPIARYDPFPEDAGALAVAVSQCELVNDTQGLYHVSYDYSSEPFDKGNSSGDPAQTDQETTPTSRPWVYKFSSTHGTRLLTKDIITGLPVVNSAGIPFDPVPEIPTSNLVISVTAFKDWATFDPVAKMLLYQDNINNANIALSVSPSVTTQFPARTLRCTEYGATSTNENGHPFWQIDITLEYKRDGWNPLKILDCGTLYKQSAGLPPQKVLDAHGQEVGPPGLPLDGSGNVLPAGGTLVFKDFSGYQEKNFATILT
jgi:hypothetical protein